MSTDSERTNADTKPRWQALGAIDRRVVGVLIEKAKTTQDAYPMSLAATRTGCNQKSNRSPAMELSLEDVEDALERLRAVGGVSCVQGTGRVDKYRHEMYQWLGVDKVELAVMGELLLRGVQTVGELRGRAARMDPIQDLAALRPILASLKSKGLLLSLTPEGRGHVVTHALYRPGEWEKIKAQFGQSPEGGEQERVRSDSPHAPAGKVAHPLDGPETPAPVSDAISRSELESLRQELEETRMEISQLRADLDDLRSEYGQSVEDLYRLKEALGG